VRGRVVATAIPGCTEIVRDGENGFLIPQKDPETLAKAIRVLLENSILRVRMGSEDERSWCENTLLHWWHTPDSRRVSEALQNTGRLRQSPTRVLH
jgi:glycosyltransferase involved in cell wall biosynthesis